MTKNSTSAVATFWKKINKFIDKWYLMENREEGWDEGGGHDDWTKEIVDEQIILSYQQQTP